MAHANPKLYTREESGSNVCYLGLTLKQLNKEVEEGIEDEEDLSARENTKGMWAELAKLVGADAWPGGDE